jgi:chromodomain-helicase-DNA-binding protein 4
MEGEGNSLKVLGFTQSQRNTFFQILMRLHSSYWFMIKEGFFMEIFAVNLIWLINNRFGVGDFNWTEFAPRIKQKTWHEINAYVII